jgi:hypothetical protein
VADCSRFDGTPDEVAAAVAGKGNDGHVALVENPTRRLDAIQARQAQIDQDEVGSVLARELDRFDSVASVGHYLVARVFENQAQVCAYDRVIFNGENSGCRKCCHKRTSYWVQKSPRRFLPEAIIGRTIVNLRRSATT